MRFLSFRIQNFKGIKDCLINVDKPDPRVFSLIGLNESGKTTILEAINYFVASDVDLQKIYNIEVSSADKAKFVPKSKKLNFNGRVQISAVVELEDADLAAVEREFQSIGYTVTERDADQIEIIQYFEYVNSDYKTSGRTWDIVFKARKKNGSKVSYVNASHPCWKAYHVTLLPRIPQVCYFPTFLFELPEKIYIEDHDKEKPRNIYYRRLLQDILDSLDEGLDIQTHIVDRIRKSEEGWSWFSFLQTDRREQVNHVLLRASAKVTSVILQSWKNVFGKSLDNKRVEFEYGHDEETDLIYIKIYLIDGSEKYDIENRSLGFRWFFCFWLFTYFRTLRAGAMGIVFLLDEPASNLHARAQEEILGNIEKLADGNNTVIYSTHSHYLISPRWLDRSYIVTNGGVSYDGVEGEFSHSGDTDISATIYRQFVGKHPKQRTYFLPVLDALEYKPSELAFERSALIVEGKCDFAFLKIAYSGDKNLGFSIIPAGGAQTMGPLFGILAGWGSRHIALLDDDKEGRDAAKNYKKSWAMHDLDIRTIAAFDPSLANMSLEKLIAQEWQEQIKEHFKIELVTNDHVRAYMLELMESGSAVTLTEKLKGFADGVKAWAAERLKSD